MTDLIIDTGCLVAAANVDDRWHKGCAEVLLSHRGRRLVPSLVIAEATYFFGKRLALDAERMLLESLAVGALRAVHPADEDWLRIMELVATYPTLGTVDASVVAAAERLGVTTIATVDRRDFGMVRPRHVAAFVLVPDPPPQRPGEASATR